MMTLTDFEDFKIAEILGALFVIVLACVTL